jgi:hypothetical protein
MRKGRRLVAAGLLLGLFLAPTARAADSDTDLARALFEEAGELERRGQWGAAQERLRGALRLRETPELHYALGWALENDDKLLEATGAYETAARLGRERSAEEATRLATARLADLEKKVPVLKVHVVAGPTARVVVDGRAIKRENDFATTSVNPGSHVVRIEQNEGVLEWIVYVGRGNVQTVEADTANAVAARPTAQDRHGRSLSPSVALSLRDNERNDRAVLPWLLVAGGVAFVAGSVALLISAESDADARDEAHARWCTLTACKGATTTRPETPEAAGFRREASDASDTKDTKQAIGCALGGAGVVAASVGAFLLLRGDGSAEKAAIARLPRARASVAPLPGGGLASAMFAF